jgi:FixJ family two-component response regulator
MACENPPAANSPEVQNPSRSVGRSGVANIPVISIIDDDELVRGAVKDLVRSLGYVATTYSSAEEYLRSDGVRNTSCLITDVQMPGMSGADLQTHLMAKGDTTPFIFMTAFANERTRTRVLQAGAFGYLQKPFDNDTLIECLETALKTRRCA